MSQRPDPQHGKNESSKVTTNDLEKKATMAGAASIHPLIRTIGTPDDLVAACRIAQAHNKKRVFATTQLMGYFLGERKDPSFTMMGIEVIEEGRESEVDDRDQLTSEQVNFPKG